LPLEKFPRLLYSSSVLHYDTPDGVFGTHRVKLTALVTSMQGSHLSLS